MKHGEFAIGCHFRCNGNRLLCTDVGSRVIVADRLGERLLRPVVAQRLINALSRFAHRAKCAQRIQHEPHARGAQFLDDWQGEVFVGVEPEHVGSVRFVPGDGAFDFLAMGAVAAPGVGDVFGMERKG